MPKTATMADVREYIRDIEKSVLNYRDIWVMRWETALDNHNPNREYALGLAVQYTHDNVETGYVLFDIDQFGDNRKLTFFVDNGETVKPFYLAAWHEVENFFILHPFTTSDNHMGPRKNYHVQVKPIKPIKPVTSV